MLPLKNFVTLDTHQLDEAREQVSQRFCSHKLEVVGESDRFHARHHVAPGAMLSLNFIHYGATVLIEPGELEHFYLVQVPLRGGADIENGAVAFQSTPQRAALLNPDRHTRMVWRAHCEQILVYIPAEGLRRFADRYLGRDLNSPIVFDPVIDLDRREFKTWRRQLLAIVANADAGQLFGRAESINQGLIEEQLLAELLTHQPSNISPFLAADIRQPVPAACRRAQEYLRANAGEAIRLADIAAAAGLPSRTLQHQFQRFYGCSPLEALRRERLMRIRCDLESGDASHNVTEIATRWGFFHFGRFSQYYRQQFGILPGRARECAVGLRGKAH